MISESRGSVRYWWLAALVVGLLCAAGCLREVEGSAIRFFPDGSRVVYRLEDACLQRRSDTVEVELLLSPTDSSFGDVRVEVVEDLEAGLSFGEQVTLTLPDELTLVGGDPYPGTLEVTVAGVREFPSPDSGGSLDGGFLWALGDTGVSVTLNLEFSDGSRLTIAVTGLED
jgi:hypothetical protein